MNALSNMMLVEPPELHESSGFLLLEQGSSLAREGPSYPAWELQGLWQLLGQRLEGEGSSALRGFLNWQLHPTVLFIHQQMDLLSMNHPGSFKHLAMVFVSPHAKNCLAQWGTSGRNPPWETLQRLSPLLFQGE